MRMFCMLLISLLLLAGCDNGSRVTINDEAASFTLQTLDNESLSLASFKGKRMMLNFWATWCGPCRDEMPHLQQAHEANDEIAIIAVNMTEQDYGATRIQAFVDEFRLTFPVVLDETGDVADAYGVITIPTTIFIDEQGRITDKISGPLTAAQIEAYMQ